MLGRDTSSLTQETSSTPRRRLSRCPCGTSMGLRSKALLYPCSRSASVHENYGSVFAPGASLSRTCRRYAIPALPSGPCTAYAYAHAAPGPWAAEFVPVGVPRHSLRRRWVAHLDGRLGVPLCAAGGGGHSVCHALLRSGVTKIGRSGWSVHILRV